MSCGELKNAMGRYHGTTSTALYYWLTPYMPATGVDTIRPILRALALAGGANFKWQLAIQTCAVRQDNPDDPALLGTEQGGAGTYAPGDLSLTLAEKAWWRLGVAVRASSGVAQGDIELDYGFNDCGKVVAFTTFSITSDSSSNPTVIPLGDILPANFAQKFKAAVIIPSADANLQTKLVYRKGTSYSWWDQFVCLHNLLHSVGGSSRHGLPV